MNKVNSYKLLTAKFSSLDCLRFMSSKSDGPKCPKMLIKGDPCDESDGKKPDPWKSMWDETCTFPPCPMPHPFDYYHYEPSDKKKRKYQRTWNECPEMKYTEKVLCCSPKYQYAEPEKRVRKIPICEPDGEKCTRKTSCMADIEQQRKCTKIVLPGCRQVRDPPSCFIARLASDCEKIECPEPSFSECEREPLEDKGRYQCPCLHVRSITEVYCKLWRQGIRVCPFGKYCY